MAAYAALVSLSHTLHQIVHPPLNTIIIDREQVDFLRAKVDFLIDFLENYRSRGSEEIEDLQMRMADAAYQAEDIIESNVVEQILASDGEKNSTLSLEGIETVLEKFFSIEQELMKIIEKKGMEDMQPRNSTRATSSRSLPGGSNTMVGFDEHLTEVMDALATDESNRRVIPIVGMGGIGKTALATAVYNNPFIVEHFHVRAWVTVSQQYTILELLLRILSEIEKTGPNRQKCTDDEIGGRLHKELFDRKYLIVMDDMWDIEAWDKVKRFLPPNSNGSRILVTTRLSNLAHDFGSCSPHQIDLLDEEKSWDLLREKVFGKQDCPIELEEIGKCIAKKCRGLPLALVVIGGLLAKFERTKEHWESVEEDVVSAINYGDDEHLMEILALSYRHLPIFLKPCFLYLSVFPEDFEIRVSWLIRLWVAEGLIRPTQAKCLEEVAHEYLDDLISRNLILVYKRRSSGKVKCCKIHDLLRDLCIIQAGKEKFVCFAKLDDPNISPNIETTRRLNISSPSKLVEITTTEALQSARFNRSWLSHGDWWIPGGSGGEPSKEWTVNQIHGFRLLKVAHVDDYIKSMYNHFHKIHIDILKLNNLRYVVAREVSSISSMSLCWNLQTLVACDNIITLPAEIWQMPQLRHLKMYGMTLPDPPEDENVIVLENLRTLETIREFKCTEQILKRIPNLKKLGIAYFSKSSAASEQVGNYCLKNLLCFEKLESLGIYGGLRGEKFWTDITLPVSLKKLALSNCKIPWEDFSIIGKLPNLEVFKWHEYDSLSWGEWNPIEGEFCRLKFLLISFSMLKSWQAENYHFPCLERLVLETVPLNEIPMSFAEILTLQVIELDGVDDSVWMSAREISNEREQLGYEPLQIRKYDRWNRWK